jgi:hypothetical protein
LMILASKRAASENGTYMIRRWRCDRGEVKTVRSQEWLRYRDATGANFHWWRRREATGKIVEEERSRIG